MCEIERPIPNTHPGKWSGLHRDAILNALPVGVLVCDLAGVHLFANQQAASMTGYTVEELLTGIWMIHPEDSEAPCFLRQALDEGTCASNHETRLVRKDGSFFWGSVSWQPAFNDAGERVGLCTAFVDISEKKTTEKALNETSVRYQMLADTASDIFFEWDLDGTITHASPSVKQLGYTSGELIGTSVFDLTHPDDREVSRARRLALLADQRPIRYEIRALARDGSVRWLEAQVNLVMEDGKPVRVHAMHRDITKRKTTEEELIRVNERYRLLAENASDIHWEMEADATITYVSQAVRKLGYEPEDWVGRRVFDFVIPDDLVASYSRRDRQLRTLKPSRSSVRLYAKDGAIVHLETQVDAVAREDQPFKFQVAARDVTEQKKAEEALRESEQRYKRIVESSNELIMLTTPEGKIAYASPASNEINGYDPEELVADNPWLVHPEDTEMMRGVFLDARCGRARSGVEYRIVTKTGETRWVSHSWSPVLECGHIQTIVSVIRDVTERKRSEEALRLAEEALRESEHKYKSIVENSSDMITLTRPNGKLMYASPAARAVTGYEPEELIGLEPWIIHPEDSERVWRLFERGMQGEPGADLEYRIVTKFGQIRWVSQKWVPIFADGQFQSILSVTRDVTERMRSQEALREAQDALKESEQKYKSIVENSQELIMLTRPDGVLMYASPAARQVTEYDPEELVGTVPWIYHPDDVERIRPVFESAMRGECGADFEYRIVTKSGETRWASHSWSPIYAGKELQSILSVVSDVTERKNSEEALRQAQDALKESEQRYKGIVENSRDLILLNAPDGPIIYASPALRDMLGYDSQEFVGRMPRLIHPEDAAKVESAFGRASMGESESNFEYRLSTKSGEVRWVSHAWSPVYSGQELQSIISIIRDITERKTAEEQLRQAHEELEQAYKLQREFLNNVTHEVRTPLTAVQGYTEMLMEGVAGPVSEEQFALLQKVMSSSDHLLDVLNAVLQIARTKSGRIALRPRVSDPRLVVETCVASVLPQARKKGVSINVTPDPDGVVATYDQEKLAIIITNLLGNAVKFTSSGSVDVMVTASAEGCEIIVADTGIGIADSALVGVFDEFTQLDYPGKHKPTGFGLGLAIVAAMVDAIGASIVASSSKNLGTAFTLVVPALEA